MMQRRVLAWTIGALCIWGMAGCVESGDRLLGEAIVRQKCTGCHAIRGEGGRIAPDLGRVGALRSRNYLETKLKHPRKTNPSSIMPSFADLPEHEFRAVITFLQSLR